MSLRSSLFSLSSRRRLQSLPLRFYKNENGGGKGCAGNTIRSGCIRNSKFENGDRSRVTNCSTSCSTSENGSRDCTSKDALHNDTSNSSQSGRHISVAGSTSTALRRHSEVAWGTPATAVSSPTAFQSQMHLHATTKGEERVCELQVREGAREQALLWRFLQSPRHADGEHHQKSQPCDIQHLLQSPTPVAEEQQHKGQPRCQITHRASSVAFLNLALNLGGRTLSQTAPFAAAARLQCALAKYAVKQSCVKNHAVLRDRERTSTPIRASLSVSWNSTIGEHSTSSTPYNNLQPCSFKNTSGLTRIHTYARENCVRRNKSAPMLTGSKLESLPSFAAGRFISYRRPLEVGPPIQRPYSELSTLTAEQQCHRKYAIGAPVKRHRHDNDAVVKGVKKRQYGEVHKIEELKIVNAKHITQVEARQHMRGSSSVMCTKRSDSAGGDAHTQQGKQEKSKEEQPRQDTAYLQKLPPAEPPLSTLTLEIADRVGSLCDLLMIFKQFDLNITQIKSTPKPLDLNRMTVSICFQGSWEELRVLQLVENLKTFCSEVKRGRPQGVPWFPRSVEDLDRIACQTLDAGADLQADHPGFQDKNYRMRRQDIASLAESYRTNSPLQPVVYTDDEKKTWKHVWTLLTASYPTCACEEFNAVLGDLRAAGVYGAEDLPQMARVNEYLQSKTGWRLRRHLTHVTSKLSDSGFTLRPVGGLLAARDFLNALAFRVFFSTQYIRHHSVPLYTPEPDVIHELLGHAPLLANPEFAEFSQLIGLASLGASEEEIQTLQRCYWFSVEFGLLFQPETNALTAYGAGLLSSPGELQHATSPTNTRIQVLRWRPEAAAAQTFPVTSFQPVLFAADSLKDVREQLLRFCHTNMKRPFAVRFDRDKRCVQVSTEVNSKPVSLQF